MMFPVSMLYGFSLRGWHIHHDVNTILFLSFVGCLVRPLARLYVCSVALIGFPAERLSQAPGVQSYVLSRPSGNIAIERIS